MCAFARDVCVCVCVHGCLPLSDPQASLGRSVRHHVHACIVAAQLQCTFAVDGNG